MKADKSILSYQSIKYDPGQKALYFFVAQAVEFSMALKKKSTFYKRVNVKYHEITRQTHTRNDFDGPGYVLVHEELIWY